MGRLEAAFAALAEDPSQQCEVADSRRIWCAALGELPAAEARALLAHSSLCPACALTWRLARGLALEAGVLPTAVPEATPEAPGLSRCLRAWATHAAWRATALRLAAVVLIGVALAFLAFALARRAVGPDSGSPATLSPWRSITVEPPPFTPSDGPGEPVWRHGQPAAPLSSLGAFREAMRPYRQRDWAGAERALRDFLTAHPQHRDARYYLGVCLLALDRPGEAVASLEDAVRGLPDTTEDPQWYLALAYLKAGREDAALARLEKVVRWGGKRRLQAEALCERIRKGGTR